MSQSLFYWIIYSYNEDNTPKEILENGLNPYFTGLSILISNGKVEQVLCPQRLNPYFTGLSILIR